MTGSRCANVLSVPGEPLEEELFSDILSRPGCRVERIVSFGQITPADKPYLQDWDEWVLLLGGAATVRVGDRNMSLRPGDHLLIPAGTPHWVTFTEPDAPTIWLAIHFS